MVLMGFIRYQIVMNVTMLQISTDITTLMLKEPMAIPNKPHLTRVKMSNHKWIAWVDSQNGKDIIPKLITDREGCV